MGNKNQARLEQPMFVDKATIEEVEDFSGKEPPFSSGGAYPARDLALQLSLRIEENGFLTKLFIGGNLNRSTAEKHRQWGSAWKIRAVFDELELSVSEAIVKNPDDSLSLKKEIIDQMVGKEIIKVSYYTPQDRRREYDRIVMRQSGESQEEAEARIRHMFLQDAERGFVQYREPKVKSAGDFPIDIKIEEDGEGAKKDTPEEEIPF